MTATVSVERQTDLARPGRLPLAEIPVHRHASNAQRCRSGARPNVGLPPCSIDGLDPRPLPARALGDLAILCLDENARRRVPVQAAQYGAGYFAVGRDCPVLVDDVEQYELDPSGRLSAPHLYSLVLRTRVIACLPSDGDAARKLALLATRSNASPLLLIR